MKQKLLFSLCLLSCSATGFSQKSVSLKLLPNINAVTSIKDGQIEIGPVLERRNKATGNELFLKPYIRVPLTDKSENVLQIDRFSDTWKGVLECQYLRDRTSATGTIRRSIFSFQAEYGYATYKYYPTGESDNEMKEGNSASAFEFKYINFHSKGAENARQYSPQARLRYAFDWKEGDEVGVVQPPNAQGVLTTTDMVIDPPGARAMLSPAVSLQYYPGKGAFSYGPAAYYDFTGRRGESDPFGNLARLRLETWIFYYPTIAGTPGVKFGLTPFLSIRTAGTDKFNPVEYGAQVTVKFGTSMLQFL